MTTYRVIIQPAAATEIEQAYLRIAADAPETATRWYNGLLGAAADGRRGDSRPPALMLVSRKGRDDSRDTRDCNEITPRCRPLW